jgi:8-oxo-dGTP diphosphatase
LGAPSGTRLEPALQKARTKYKVALRPFSIEAGLYLESLMAKNKAVPAVFLLLVGRGVTFPMLRRQNTGHMDGKLSLPAGKIEAGELPENAAIREGLEEAGITISPEDLHLAHVQYHSSPESLGGDYINFYFFVQHWEGEVVNAEPKVCSEFVNVALDDVPNDAIPYVAEAIARCNRDYLSYSTYVSRPPVE